MISSNKSKGFTLVELLIVIVVIAILAAISIVAYNGVTNKARDDERASNARNLLNAAAAYNSDNDKWPELSDLAAFETIKLPTTVTDATKVNATVDAGKDTYKYRLCKDSGFTTNKAEATGVEVQYLKEADPDKGVKTIKTGKCS
ncbi:MAG: prepilin-type N-terminal cleavage/methylation domain-containing protein [Candidatus Saccharibacteria bacterium]|nr:prepilin-type N-terminal cleavage/methylation domain-containing protein [Candidatus Saccharibacteria bacterium]